MILSSGRPMVHLTLALAPKHWLAIVLGRCGCTPPAGQAWSGWLESPETRVREPRASREVERNQLSRESEGKKLKIETRARPPTSLRA